jgi:hypothetical protein
VTRAPDRWRMLASPQRDGVCCVTTTRPHRCCFVLTPLCRVPCADLSCCVVSVCVCLATAGVGFSYSLDPFGTGADYSNSDAGTAHDNYLLLQKFMDR